MEVPFKFPSGEVRRDSLNKFRPFLGGIGIVILNVKNAKSHNVPLSFLERSIDCTSALMFVLSILKLSRNAIELQTVS